jgi:antitoxin component YwqK of YwqJK toxin-antitoxin module
MNAGILIQEGYYLHGKEDGEWKFYTSTGELEFTGSYSQGRETGIWYRYEKGKKKVYKRY